MQWPMLAICAAVPSALMWAMIFVKARCAIRTRWRKPIPEMPAMLPRVPTLEESDDSAVRDWLAVQERREPSPPLELEGEAERAQRLAKMFS
jgi:hypothetical protein